MLADGPNAFLLESVEGGENWGRYSIIGLPCRRAWRASGRKLERLEFGRVVEQFDDVDPLAEIRDEVARHRAPRLDELPGFSGGLVGYFGYETVAHLEPKLDFSGKPDELGVPEILLLEAEELAVFDNLAGRLYLIVNADPSESDAFDRAQRRLDQLVHRLRCGSPGYPPPMPLPGIEKGHPRNIADLLCKVGRISDDSEVRAEANYRHDLSTQPDCSAGRARIFPCSQPLCPASLPLRH